MTTRRIFAEEHSLLRYSFILLFSSLSVSHTKSNLEPDSKRRQVAYLHYYESWDCAFVKAEVEYIITNWCVHNNLCIQNSQVHFFKDLFYLDKHEGPSSRHITFNFSKALLLSVSYALQKMVKIRAPSPNHDLQWQHVYCWSGLFIWHSTFEPSSKFRCSNHRLKS